MKPVVAIVGRTNVGKSTLFNHIVGRRLAIIEDEPGVTRDRLYCDVEHDGTVFTLIDTGGLVDAPIEELSGPIAQQSIAAMAEADVIVFMVDGLVGLVPADLDIAELVRGADKPTVLAINKTESPKKSDELQFAALGLEHAVPVSAKGRMNIAYLLDEVVGLFPEVPPAEEPQFAYDFAAAIVGRPNVGKSSLLNLLLGHERSVVSEMPGTTRDAIDSLLEWEGHRILLTDTAGMRRKARVHEDVEYYSVVRALRAVDRADLVLLMVDAQDGITEQDQRIAGYAHENGRLVILVVNKWDLITDVGAPSRELPYQLDDPMSARTAAKRDKRLRTDWQRSVRDRLVFLEYSPVLFVSALKQRGMELIVPQMLESIEQYRMRVSTAGLNRLMLDAATEHAPPMRRGRRLRVYYATQAEASPPTFILFVNEPDLMHFSYERYLKNRIREAFSMTGTPIRLELRRRQREDWEGEGGAGARRARPSRKQRPGEQGRPRRSGGTPRDTGRRGAQ